AGARDLRLTRVLRAARNPARAVRPARARVYRVPLSEQRQALLLGARARRTGSALRAELVGRNERRRGPARPREIRRGARVRLVAHGRRRPRARHVDPRARRLVPAVPWLFPLSLEPSARAG